MISPAAHPCSPTTPTQCAALSSAMQSTCCRDIGRGVGLYEEPGFESSQLASFLTGAPLAGLFGSGQVSTAKSKASVYEMTSAIAVLRPLPPPASQRQPE